LVWPRGPCLVVSALRVLSGCLVQAPNCCFGSPFLGVIHGGTVGCSSLTSWCVQGAGWFYLWALDLVEVFGSMGGGATFEGPWRESGRSGRYSGIRAQESNEICNELITMAVPKKGTRALLARPCIVAIR
ncbi:hypothetical protein Taro_051353, partial [Colocasia esculenta]|nr:hypothetical protein [Colocasia esculenta]